MPTIKIKAFLLNLYPELHRFNLFKQIQAELLPHLDPRMKNILRISLPIFILVIVLGIGLPLGLFILGFFTPRTVTPPSINVVTQTTTPTYQSPFIPLRNSITDFNPNLPDPAPPVVDSNITLESPTQ